MEKHGDFIPYEQQVSLAIIQLMLKALRDPRYPNSIRVLAFDSGHAGFSVFTVSQS